MAFCIDGAFIVHLKVLVLHELELVCEDFKFFYTDIE